MNSLHPWPKNLGSTHIILTKEEVKNGKSLIMEESFSEGLSDGGSSTRSKILKGLRMIDRDCLGHTKRYIHGINDRITSEHRKIEYDKMVICKEKTKSG